MIEEASIITIREVMADLIHPSISIIADKERI
jgi:hypothetical protein